MSKVPKVAKMLGMAKMPHRIRDQFSDPPPRSAPHESAPRSVPHESAPHQSAPRSAPPESAPRPIPPKSATHPISPQLPPQPFSKYYDALTGLLTSSAVFCLLLLVFVIAIAVVASLIPLYISKKSATKVFPTQTSNPFFMYINTGVTNSIRKRQNNLDSVRNYIGSQFASTSILRVQDQLTNVLRRNSKFSSLNITSIRVVQGAFGKKRHVFMQRRGSQPVYLAAYATITYVASCGKNCQDMAGSAIRLTLQNQVNGNVLLCTNIQLTQPNGQFWTTLPNIPVDGVYLVTPIGSAMTTQTG